MNAFERWSAKILIPAGLLWASWLSNSVVQLKVDLGTIRQAVTAAGKPVEAPKSAARITQRGQL